MNFFDHKGLGNHLWQLCPKVVKHPVYRGLHQRFRKSSLKDEHLAFHTVNNILCLIKHHLIQTFVKVNLQLYALLTDEGVDCSASEPGRFNLRTHYTDSHVAPRLSLENVDERKISALVRN